MIEEPTKKIKEGETDDLQLPDSPQPEQQASDADQMDPQQFGSQRLNSQQSNRQHPDLRPPDPNMPGNSNSARASSANIPMITFTEPTQENPDGETNGDTQRQHMTDGDNDDANVTKVTEM